MSACVGDIRDEMLLRYENELYLRGYKKIAGVDEAGRGPLAGPVVAAAVMLPKGYYQEGIDDSKALTPKKRKELYRILTQNPDIIYGVGIVDVETIDGINILNAALLAMKKAVLACKVRADFLLIDGNKTFEIDIERRAVVKGDSLSLSIAAASIIAKEVRDTLMQEYHQIFPMYEFNKHKGYGTKRHRELIYAHGPCEIHRRSFEPIKSILNSL